MFCLCPRLSELVQLESEGNNVGVTHLGIDETPDRSPPELTRGGVAAMTVEDLVSAVAHLHHQKWREQPKPAHRLKKRYPFLLGCLGPAEVPGICLYVAQRCFSVFCSVHVVGLLTNVNRAYSLSSL